MSQPASQADPLLSHVTPLDSLGPLDEVSPVVPNLFTVSGVPMTFYVAPCTKRTHIQNLILSNGGELSKTSGDDVYVLVDSAEKSELPGKVQNDCFSTDFVIDSVIKTKLMDINLYLLTAEKPKKSSRRDKSISSSRKRHKYTQQQDIKLALFIKNKNISQPSSSKVWKEAEELEIAQGHTWQSMRSRFSKVIQPKLEQYAQEKQRASGTSYLDDSDDVPLWSTLNEQEIKEVLNDPNAKSNENQTDRLVFIPPSLLRLDMDPKYTIATIINYLHVVTQQPQSVVIHALIVTSGVVQDALEYLQNPREFCARKSRKDQVWTHSEDKILLEKDKDKMAMLTEIRGEGAIAERLSFLES